MFSLIGKGSKALLAEGEAQEGSADKCVILEKGVKV